MNILILSAGTRNKVVQYFKQEVGDGGKVIATDCSNLAPAVYEADQFYLVPRITEEGYLDVLLDICRKEKIDAVLSLIDPELSILARERERFLEAGCMPVISSAETVELSFDKYRMYQKLCELGFRTGRCFVDKELFFEAVDAGELTWPVFVKPVTGSASIHISRVSSRKEVELLFSMHDDLMIQEYMDGQEYGADVYVDMISGKVTSLFVKKKIKMRAGETDKAVSVRDDRLFELIRDFTETMGYRGIIDIDIFEIEGEYYISEVNPRFGGGYPHAHECGINVPAQILKNLSGEENPVNIGDYKEHVYMMKYNEIMIREGIESDE